MDAVLITLTIFSLAAAAAFGALAWRTLGDERRRSAARVAALASAIQSVDVVAPAGTDARPVAMASMFETASGAASTGRPVIKAAVVATLAVALIIVTAMANRDHADQAVAPEETAPLELVSMRHTRDGGTLTVAGLVRNPRTGALLTRIAAVVLAFDRSGSFVASGRAALDFTTLEPGDESPFVVTLPHVAEVGRYRVSFRTETGVLPHVDRRAVQTVRVEVSAN